MTEFSVGDRVEFIENYNMSHEARFQYPKGTRAEVTRGPGSLSGTITVRRADGHSTSVLPKRLKKISKFEPGMRVRISENPGACPDGSGYVDPRFAGEVGTVVRRWTNRSMPDNWSVRLDGVGENHIHESFLTPAGAETEATADTALTFDAEAEGIVAGTTERQLSEIKHAFAKKARQLAREHGWCEVVDEALDDLGLADYGRPKAPEGWAWVGGDDGDIHLTNADGAAVELVNQLDGEWTLQSLSQTAVTPAQLRAAADHIESWGK